MTTFNTGNPIGSTDARDLSDNAENFDKALSSLGATWKDRFGRTRDSFEGALSRLSFYRVGSFTAGYTLTNMRQTLEYNGHEYSWAGTFPKAVAAGATPATSGGIGAGAWVDRTDVTLRGELAASDGTELIGVSLNKNLYTKIQESLLSPLDDSNSDVPLSIANILNTDKGLLLPKGVIVVNSPIIVDGSKTLSGYGSSVSILKPAVGYNGPIVKVINSYDANATIKSVLSGFSIIGQLDLNASKQDGILVTADPAKGGTYTCRFSINDVIVTRLGGSAIHLNGCTASTITNCDLLINRYFGIHLDNTPVDIGIFNNIVDIFFNRIKHNSVGLYGQGYTNQGITVDPSGTFSAEISKINIIGNLFEANLGSFLGNWYDYSDGLGSSSRPGIAILCEATGNWLVQGNWFEAAYQMIKFNGTNKAHDVKNNKFNYLGSEAAAITDYNYQKCAAVVFSSNLENTLNTISENFFGFANTFSGGMYQNVHLIFDGVKSQGNRIVRNTCDIADQVRSITVNSGVFADKNFVEDIIASDNTAMKSRISKGYGYSAPNIAAEVNTLTTQAVFKQVGNPTQRFDLYGYNLGSAVSKRQWNFVRVDAAGSVLATHGIIELALRPGDISGSRTIMFGAFTPEGSITANVGSLYLRTDGGASSTLYIKESGTGNTGWVAK